MSLPLFFFGGGERYLTIVLINNYIWVGQKSRSDRDWKERDPPNRGCRGFRRVQSFAERPRG